MYTKNAQSSPKDTVQKHPRGGLGNKGNPLAIKQSIAEAVRDVQRTGHDLEKIKKNKEELLADLADLRIREKEVVEDNLSEEVRGLIKKNILNIQKRLNEINGIIPEVNLSDDQKKIQKIINEWDTAKKEKRSALAVREKAEAELAKDPSNMKVMGKANRASATIYANTQEMERALHEAQIIKKSFTHDPVLDESVNIHTGEELVTKKSTTEHKETKKAYDPVRDEGISYTHKQVVIDQDKYHETHKPIQKASLLEEKKSGEITTKTPPEKKIEAIKKITKQDSKESAPSQIKEYDYAEATKNLLLQMNRVLVKNKATAGTIPKKKELPPVFSLKPAENHLLLNDGEHIPRSRFTSLKNTLRGSFAHRTKEQKTKEGEPPSLAQRTLLRHLDILFGKSGFLGFGARAGADSPHWKDDDDGFAKKTVEDIFATHQGAPKENTSEYFGIKNYDATEKMKKYLSQAFEQTKISPNPKERAGDYLLRIITTIFDKK